MIVIDPTARVSPLADIEDSTRGSRIELGAGVVVDSFVKIKPAGGSGDVWIGAGSHINSGCVLYVGNGITIGEHVLIAANCTLAPTNHAYLDKDRRIVEQRFLPSRGGIVIEDDCWLGAGCVVLDGARIRRGAVIGAGSLVRGEVESYGVYVGNPLRRVGQRVSGGVEGGAA
jgi:acetyltransferase-like isoleucine patch superfamily enzyme